MHCACGQDITETWMMPMDAREFTRRLKAMRCPTCFGKKLFMGHKKQEAAGG